MKNCFLYYGTDEGLIKELIQKNLHSKINFPELNDIYIDGRTVSSEEIINACETLPAFSDNKVVTVFRALFLREKQDSHDKMVCEAVSKYIKDVPDFCTLIFYYILENPREKIKITKSFQSCAEVNKVSPLRGEELLRKVSSILESRDMKMDKVLLNLFCNQIDTSLFSIYNEVDKLRAYTLGTPITKEILLKLIPGKNDDDIFALVDAIAAKKLEMALDIFNELIFKGVYPIMILSMVERQFKMIYSIKVKYPSIKSKEAICKELSIIDFIFEKIRKVVGKFSEKELERIFNYCIECEGKIKSNTIDQKMEVEILIVKAINSGHIYSIT